MIVILFIDEQIQGNMSMSAKLSLMSLSRVIASVGIAAVMEPSVQPSYQWSAAGFFDHWTLATWNLGGNHVSRAERRKSVNHLESKNAKRECACI